MTNDNNITLGARTVAPMTYGIQSLDDVLGQYSTLGHLHLVGGFTGSGKTALACQLTARNVLLGKKVHYLSTEVDGRDFLVRCVSNGAQIEYDENMQFEMTGATNGQMNPIMPKVGVYEDDECERGGLILQQLNKQSEFCPVDTSDGGLTVTKVRQAMDDSQIKPEIVILDYLSWAASSDDPHHARTQMIEVIQYMRQFAQSKNIIVVVFAQLNVLFQDRMTVPVNATCACRTLHEHADVSIAMSWLEVPALDEAGEAGYSDNQGYLREQYLRVQGRNIKAMIPVKTHYHRMALECGDHKVDERSRDHITALRDRKKAREVLDAGGMNHYVWLGRSVYQKVCSMGYPPAINVYVFHMLVAKKSGWSHHSYKGMAEKLGLSVEQIRTAIDKLKAAGLLKGQGNKRDTKRQVVPRVENKARGDTKGGVKLNQNMTRSEFTVLKDPDQFRIWLWLLCNAESNYESGRKLPGEVVVLPEKLTEMLKTGREKVEEALREFVRDQRVEYTYGDLSQSSIRLRLVNWHSYQYDLPGELADGYKRMKKVG